MLGYSFGCNNCDFEFCSGWSHHVGGQFLVCSKCATQYILGGGSSCWGPRDGETLELLGQTSAGVGPTGIRAIAHTSKTDCAWNGVVKLRLDAVECPTCHSLNSLVQSFEKNAPCPSCKSGTINKDGSCIY